MPEEGLATSGGNTRAMRVPHNVPQALSVAHEWHRVLNALGSLGLEISSSSLVWQVKFSRALLPISLPILAGSVVLQLLRRSTTEIPL